MRCFFVALAVWLFAVSVLAAQYPINELPMYGGIEKSDAMLKADDVFIGKVLEQGYSKETGARHFSMRGWQAFSDGDLSTAVKRFNQSWLLDKELYETYWGFALVYVLRDHDIPNGSAMFEKALSLRPDQGNFYVEYGRFLEENDAGSLDKAIDLVKKGLAMNPDIRDGYLCLIKANFRKNDFEQMRFWFEQGKSRKVFQPSELEGIESDIAQVEAK